MKKIEILTYSYCVILCKVLEDVIHNTHSLCRFGPNFVKIPCFFVNNNALKSTSKASTQTILQDIENSPEDILWDVKS